MNRYAFLHVLWRGLYKTAVPVSGFYGLAITIATLSGGLSAFTVAPFGLAVSGAVILLVVSTFAAAAWISFEASQERSPRVRVAMRQSFGSESRVVCLLNSSPNFAVGMAVSFFVTNPNGFEVQIGIGAVTAIQQNGYTQIDLLAPAPGYEDIVTKLGDNE